MIIGSTSNSLLIGVSVVVGGCPLPRWGRVGEGALLHVGVGSLSGVLAAGTRRRAGQFWVGPNVSGKSKVSPRRRWIPRRELGGSSFEDKPGGIDCSFGGLWCLFLAVHKSINSKKINQLSSLPPFDSAVLSISIFPLSLPFCFAVYQLCPHR